MAYGAATHVEVDGHPIRISSPDKPVFPGLTKLQVVEYVAAVGSMMLTHIGGRPTAFERWPDGVHEGADAFFQKHVPKSVPDYVHDCGVVFPSGRPARMVAPDSVATLVWAAQMGAITFHPWPTRAPHTDRPDQLRLDFDPSPGLGFADAVRAALMAKELLDEWRWPAFAKTSGNRGVHVYVPIEPEWSFVDVRHAAIAVGRELERRAPELITMSWWKEERGEKVFVDFNQNAQDRLMAGAYSLRPRPQATVSMPVSWEQLIACDPLDFTLSSVLEAVQASGWSDAWAGIDGSAVRLDRAVEQWQCDVEAGLPELPYPPDFPKMPGEPPRVQPSRARRAD